MEEVVLRLEELPFPSSTDVAVLSVDVNDEVVRIEARRTVAGVACPGCGIWSRRVHSSYLRFPADVPSGGRRVALCLHVRRFLCSVTSCGQRTFAEQLPGLTLGTVGEPSACGRRRPRSDSRSPVGPVPAWRA
ncbi:transposase family protein [Streptomyces cinerochromogenes]|uniref:transposase family protein n=1 Tax=Streptomyces cinerochromogenes TaxID=66422 RepID=UPI0036B0A8F6